MRIKQFAIMLVVWSTGVSLTGFVCRAREMQLRVILAERRGCDALVSSGTRSRETLPIAHTMLLDDPADHWITIMISPLKCLQVTQLQESDFNTKYGISTVVINDDTTSENSWWDVSCNLNFITINSFNYYSTQENIQHIHYGPHIRWITTIYPGNFHIHRVFWWILSETLSGEFPKATPVEFISPASWMKFTRSKKKKEENEENDYIQPLIWSIVIYTV